MNGSACNMEKQTAREKIMTLEQKRIHFYCHQYKLSCSNCPLYQVPKNNPKKRS